MNPFLKASRLSILLILLTALPSFASSSVNNCSSIDLRSQFGVVQNQSATGLCYAAATADFLSFYLKKPVSSMDIAVNYMDRASGLEVGLRKAVMGLLKGPEAWVLGALPKMALDRLGKTGICLESTPTAAHFELAQTAMLARLGPENFQCEGQRTKPFTIELDLQGPGTIDGTIEAAMELINRELDHQRIAMILYNAKTVFPEQKAVAHVSNLVGRRWNVEKNQCEYLIRNSWGPENDEAGYSWAAEEKISKAVDTAYSLISLKFQK